MEVVDLDTSRWADWGWRSGLDRIYPFLSLPGFLSSSGPLHPSLVKNAFPRYIKEGDATTVVAVGKIALLWQWKNNSFPPLFCSNLSLPHQLTYAKNPFSYSLTTILKYFKSDVMSTWGFVPLQETDSFQETDNRVLPYLEAPCWCLPVALLRLCRQRNLIVYTWCYVEILYICQCKIAYTSGTTVFCILIPLQRKHELVPFLFKCVSDGHFEFQNGSHIWPFFLGSICNQFVTTQ